MREVGQVAAATLEAFTRVHRTVFLGDPAANPRLPVDVLAPATVVDTPTLVLLTPWTLNGLLFPPDDDVPTVLVVAGRARRVHSAEVDGLGGYRSVNLVADVSRWRGPEQARTVARSWVEPFRAAVAEARAAQRRDPSGAPQ